MLCPFPLRWWKGFEILQTLGASLVNTSKWLCRKKVLLRLRGESSSIAPLRRRRSLQAAATRTPWTMLIMARQQQQTRQQQQQHPNNNRSSSSNKLNYHNSSSNTNNMMLKWSPERVSNDILLLLLSFIITYSHHFNNKSNNTIKSYGQIMYVCCVEWTCLCIYISCSTCLWMKGTDGHHYCVYVIYWILHVVYLFPMHTVMSHSHSVYGIKKRGF